MATPDDTVDLTLHHVVWHNDIPKLKKLLDKENEDNQLAHMNDLDPRGNTPLHIAAHFGYEEAAKVLIDHGADFHKWSSGGWRALEEAVASGFRNVAKLLYKASMDSMRTGAIERAPVLHAELKELPDFYLELGWAFGSWVPLVSKFFPCDTYRIWKKGTSLRMDVSLIGFQNLTAQRGNITFLFTGEDAARPGRMLMLDRDKKTTTDFACGNNAEEEAKKVEEVLDYLFSHDICSRGGETNNLTFEPQYGWFGGEQKEEQVEKWSCKMFTAKGFEFRSLIRSDPEVKKTRAQRKPMPQHQLDRYRNSEKKYFEVAAQGKPCGMIWGHEKISENKKEFSGTVWMAPDFPLTLAQLALLTKVLAPTSEQLTKLDQFLHQQLPPHGFPVKINIPVFFAISATINFLNYRPGHDIKDSMFDVPEDFEDVKQVFSGIEVREMFKTVKSSGDEAEEKEKASGRSDSPGNASWW
eukprot:TRINITY_DN611_c0_g1_i1.p1 TRINITY_DN611_c0_g1~~TRINITY_DN611_c0_g1_i1.p1  ORF type:complete len:468 (+),score=124.41 TRINITY_DN611_c0_g1_i1:249-1652(+)